MMITVLVDGQNVWKVREEKNEPAVPAVPTLKDVVEQYNAETQQELENVVELQVQIGRSHQIRVIILLRWNNYLTPVKSSESSKSNIAISMLK